MKQITIIGNLGSNAVSRTTADGRNLMTFNVAVNQANAEPIWFNCIGTLRERLFPFLVKGQCVCVIGDLQAGIYQNRIDLTVNLDRVELCGKAPEQTTQEPAAQSASQPAAAPQQSASQPAAASPETLDWFDASQQQTI